MEKQLNDFMDKYQIYQKFKKSFLTYLRNSYFENPSEYTSIDSDISAILNKEFEFYSIRVSYNIRSWPECTSKDIAIAGRICKNLSGIELLEYSVIYDLNGIELDDYIIFL